MDQIEKKIVEIIEAHREEIIAIGTDIFNHAELGYKEYRTSELFCKHMEKLGVETEKNLAVTGVKGYLNGKEGKDGPTVAVIGELDALPIKDSPYTNQETGASHSCGHNAQMAAVMGAAFALCDEEVRQAMDGNIVFFAVPAEEYVEIEFKNGLMKEGLIGYGGGKCELIRVGAFDDIDIALGHHANTEHDAYIMNNRSNGFLSKIVRYKGKSAHAAGAPFDGVDALNAAMLGMQAITAQQESYRDCDNVRVHGFISEGGEAMNIIADRTTLEYSVRANNIPAIENANEKFDRAARSGAVATGCGVEIVTMPGYLPTIPVNNVRALEETLKEFEGEYEIAHMDPDFCMGGSTDFGDVSQIMPLLQFYTGGFSDILHDKNLHPINEDVAYVLPAKIFALTAYKLLKNQAEYAKELLEGFKPLLTKEQYIEFMDGHNQTEEIPMAPLKHKL